MSNGAILNDLAARFKIRLGDDNLLAGKKAIFEILALAEVCALWVL